MSPFLGVDILDKSLTDVLKGKVVILGIGNPLRGDDGFGPVLVQRLQGEVPAVCIDAGTSPESYLGKIVQESPDTILIVDAVHLKSKSGDYEILTPSEILASGFTTHDISPKLLMDYLHREIKAEIYMLGIEPERVTLGSEMSEPVKKALNNVVREVKEALGA
ncbi:MAG: hydrogenase 3 maturation endopeptidase HyCI [Candidatus Omnitrophica bacterium]|nr:hydrogenase 3 maturation endopeptidase HyCI [Candidatus Omnitrophota bacterium]